MDPIIGGALIGAGASYIGSQMSDKSAEAAAKKNAEMQEKFAKQGIQWKVADAKAAGISPEFALGAPTASFSPTETGSQSGAIMADAGQNIARSVLASSTKADRELDAKLKAETLRGMTLENNLKDPALTSINVPGNPPFPHPRGNIVPGQGNTAVVKDVALERTGQSRSARHSEGGSIPSVGWAETHDGGLRPVPSQDVKNRIEDQMIPETLWALQHLGAPNIGAGPKPPQDALPKGYSRWRWDHGSQAYYPAKGSDSSNSKRFQPRR